MCKCLVGAVACFCLGGLYGRPRLSPPETKMPDNFVAASSEGQKPAENNGNQPVIDAAKWWQALNDQELNSLIDRAIKANPDIGIAWTACRKRETQEIVVMGGALPCRRRQRRRRPGHRKRYVPRPRRLIPPQGRRVDNTKG